MAETFTAKSTGATVTLRPVPLRYVMEYGAKFADPDPKDYSDPSAYAADLSAAQLLRQFETFRFLIYQGIANDAPAQNQWGVDFDQFGLEKVKPEDKVGYKVQWVETAICPHPDDMIELLLKLMALSGLNERVMGQITALVKGTG